MEDRNGYMGEHSRVCDATDLRAFVLVDSDEGANDHPDITFTQKDVRELQLVKGAMRTGIDVLLETNGLTADDIDRVIVASAMAIGMLPRLPLDRFRQVGNAAGMGTNA